MKSLRHRLGRWLLRDAPTPGSTVGAKVTGDEITRAIRKEMRRRGVRHLI